MTCKADQHNHPKPALTMCRELCRDCVGTVSGPSLLAQPVIFHRRKTRQTLDASKHIGRNSCMEQRRQMLLLNLPTCAFYPDCKHHSCLRSLLSIAMPLVERSSFLFWHHVLSLCHFVSLSLYLTISLCPSSLSSLAISLSLSLFSLSLSLSVLLSSVLFACSMD